MLFEGPRKLSRSTMSKRFDDALSELKEAHVSALAQKDRDAEIKNRKAHDSLAKVKWTIRI
jgi:hypothetical protein